jgi:hypothetical protein
MPEGKESKNQEFNKKAFAKQKPPKLHTPHSTLHTPHFFPSPSNQSPTQERN